MRERSGAIGENVYQLAFGDNMQDKTGTCQNKRNNFWSDKFQPNKKNNHMSNMFLSNKTFNIEPT